jgi:hypothetical protein
LSQPESTLPKIVNAPELVKAFGRTYEIKKFTLGPMTQALEHVGILSVLLQSLYDLPKKPDGSIDTNPKQILTLVSHALMISGPAIFGIISIATKEPPEWLEEQDTMEGLRLFAKVVEKNLDFFSQKTIDEVVELIGSMTPSTGGGSSTS